MASLIFAAAYAQVDFPLLEASGAAQGRVLVAGEFAPNSYGALLQDQGDVLLLSGPTPHVVETHSFIFGSGKPVAGAAAVTPAGTALCIIQGSADAVLACAALSPPAKAAELAIPGALDLAALAPNALLVLSSDAKPFKFVSTDYHLRVINATDLGVAARAGYAWRAVGSGAGLFAAVRSSADLLSLDVFLFSAPKGQQRSALKESDKFRQTFSHFLHFRSHYICFFCQSCLFSAIMVQNEPMLMIFFGIPALCREKIKTPSIH